MKQKTGISMVLCFGRDLAHKLDVGIESFVGEIAKLIKNELDEPLDGNCTELIAKAFLEELDDVFANK